MKRPRRACRPRRRERAAQRAGRRSYRRSGVARFGGPHPSARDRSAVPVQSSQNGVESLPPRGGGVMTTTARRRLLGLHSGAALLLLAGPATAQVTDVQPPPTEAPTTEEVSAEEQPARLHRRNRCRLGGPFGTAALVPTQPPPSTATPAEPLPPTAPPSGTTDSADPNAPMLVPKAAPLPTLTQQPPATQAAGARAGADRRPSSRAPGPALHVYRDADGNGPARAKSDPGHDHAQRQGGRQAARQARWPLQLAAAWQLRSASHRSVRRQRRLSCRWPPTAFNRGSAIARACA